VSEGELGWVLALVGISRSGKKFGNILLQEFTAKDYRVSVVHPSAGEIDGTACYPALADLSEGVGGQLIAVPPAQTEMLVREAAAGCATSGWCRARSRLRLWNSAAAALST
jgi:predicted CoA-binding protein